MQATNSVTLDRSTLANLLYDAEFAAHLVGHLDDDAHRELIGQISDRVDAVVHGLTEILGAPDGVVHDGTPRLKAITGGAP